MGAENEPLNLSRESTDVSEEEVEVPFNLPASEVVWRSHVHSAIAIFFVVGTLVAMFMAPTGKVLDIPGFIACGYIFFLFVFQNTFIEWPAVPAHILLLIACALGALAGPTGLQACGLWESWITRGLVWAADVAIILAGYRCMVRGPAYAELDEEAMDGRTFVITGCNTGLGYETAKTLALAGATVVFACRSEDRARASMKKLVDEADGEVEEEQLHFIPLDTSNFASVRNFASLLEKSGLKPHTLILNAGVMLRSRSLSKDGLEMTMATNHFGHFLLVNLLLPSLLEAENRGEQPRIVIVGSNMSYMHATFDFSECAVVSGDEKEKEAYLQRPYELFRSYGQSKLANLHFTTELARRLKKKGSKIPVNQIHPGEVLTEVMRDMHPVILQLYKIFEPVAYGFLKSAPQGAFCSLHVATDPSLATSKKVNGAHFVRCSPAPLSKAGGDKEVAAKLWDISEKVTGMASMV